MASLWNAAQKVLNPRPDMHRLPHRPSGGEEPSPAETPARGRLSQRDVLRNAPLCLGGLIVLGLFFVVLFGPLWAPDNPYLTGQRTITYEDGQIVVPPFAPSPAFPLGTDQWGRDILSLLLYGTRNTLVACTFVTMARLALGLLLGGLAGWNEGRFVDRLVMGGIGLTTALPMLISCMILIFALDIRRGLPVFIVALSLVGWGTHSYTLVL